MKILSELYRADAGQIMLDGEVVKFSDPRATETDGIAVTHQDLNLAPALRVDENVFLGREPTRFGLVNRRKTHFQDFSCLEIIFAT